MMLAGLLLLIASLVIDHWWHWHIAAAVAGLAAFLLIICGGVRAGARRRAG